MSPGIQMWTLCVLLSWMCVVPALGELQYMVAVSAVLEAGAETRFCASLLKPNMNVVMTVTLRSETENTTLFMQTSNEEFHTCTQFKAPLVQNPEVQRFEVEVRGDGFYSKRVQKLMIKVYQPMTFIQTDKPIYLPGQTVHFRVVSLDIRFRPANQLYDAIYLEDAQQNRIGQWLNETSNSKILQLSYSLNSEAREGTYTIAVSVGGNKVYHWFKVEKYVLPKFDVKINSVDEVFIKQQEFKVEVCAKYTYGQPVPGSVEVVACRPLESSFRSPVVVTPEHPEGIPAITAPCYKDTQQLNRKGCNTFTFRMSAFTTVDNIILTDVLSLSAKVKEEGTDITRLIEKNVQISYVVGKLSFFDTPTIFEQGSYVNGNVKAMNHNNEPIADMTLYLFVSGSQPTTLLQILTTNSDGVASFSLNTTNYSTDIALHVDDKPKRHSGAPRTPSYVDGEHRLSLVQDVSPVIKTFSSLEVKNKDKPLPCDTEEDVFIQYTVVGEKEGNVDVMYLVLSRGVIIMQGHKQVEVQSKQVNEGEVSFKIKVSPEMAPIVHVVAYAVLPSERVIATTARFSTEKCFANKVSLEFSPSSAVPGEETTLKVTSAPDSLCGVSAVDQSVLIQEPGESLDADKIFSLLPVVTDFTYEVEEIEPECLPLKKRRSVFNHRFSDNDAYPVFKRVGLKMATNLLTRTPTCVNFKGSIYHHSKYFDCSHGVYALQTYEPAPGHGPFPPHYSLLPVIRTFFPETWIWDLVHVGESGQKDVSLTVPDTITTWETEAFCLSPQGFGLAPRKQITVFQPFFLELTLPYSIIRGENFVLKATVFNYLSSCIMVTVTPAPSPHYTLTPLSGDQYTSCLCGSERKTLSWTMDPSSLGTVNVSVSAEAVASHATCDNEIVSVPDRGRIDVVTKSLIVKAEGTEIVKAYNWLLCPKGEALTEEVELQLPQNVIDGSAQASVSVLGDILGRALQNLEGLLRMPYGCGEQNMALLAPNIYILQYLKNTQQLSPDINEKATNLLTSGYQRQLNYKHSDGAFSTFGSGAGNTWLTAFVMRCFSKAQSFIYIDPTKIEESKTWLINKQKANGCFEQSVPLFNNRMKGGVSDEVTLSAYITAAFLEMNTSPDSQVITKSLSCLKESISDLSNTYTTALLAYVFTLAGDKETRSLLLQHLDKVASKEGGFLYWSQSSEETSASLSVEISSYVLLAKLSASPTAEDLGYCSSIVRWLTGQQNQYGGFSSTQDTVVALQALALYSTLVFSPTGSSTVTVQSPSGQLTFDVNQNNKLLYQEKTLQDTTGKYSLEVKGTACASLQISHHYNIPTPADATSFSLEVTPEANCTKTHKAILTLKLRYQYRGKGNYTNMVILDIKNLSGFFPDPKSLYNIKQQVFLDRIEEEEDHILVYVALVSKKFPMEHTLDLVQEVAVHNLKPAVVKIYDYYQPSAHAETEYIYPCAAGVGLQ
ncbi:alpha-2-macroglobulin-like isoform X2 [Betta splendens]|uniref:Alpha-2-macroglobulin-like isoform X2 n=1 Tax=Betta splendens TaxID=158456 RepID=A0A6P7PD74_BETSP|nr:alpha-2-macroglobulin-like isoform X2 [Betta splendens]